MKVIKKYFKNFDVKNIKTDISDEYYHLKSENDEIFIKSDFFVMSIFTHGSKWADHLFSDIYNQEPQFNDITNKIENFEGISVNIDYNGTLFKNAILIPHIKSENNKNIKKEDINDGINLSNIVIRIMKKKISLDMVEKLGGSSQFLLSENEKVEVELLQNNKVVGRGILEKMEDGYSLEITEVIS